MAGFSIAKEHLAIAVSLLLTCVILPQIVSFVLLVAKMATKIVGVIVIVEAAIVLLFKAIYPQKVDLFNVSVKTMSWIACIVEGLVTMFLYILFSMFDLIVGLIGFRRRAQNDNKEVLENMKNERKSSPQTKAKKEEGNQLRQPLIMHSNNRDTYAALASKAMTGQHYKPAKPLRFSI